MKTGITTMAVVLCAAPFACSTGDHHVEDEGKVCLYASAPEAPGSNSPAQTFAEGDRLYVSVSLDECLSACIRNEVTSCTVERQDDELIVTSTFDYSDPDGSQACIALCYAPTALCQSEALPAGTYNVVHGGVDSGTLSIPATDVPPCLD